jgi:uncharacterized caspase-like protein
MSWLRASWVRAALAFASLCLLLAQPAVAEKRVALVIGNAAYVHSGPLPNPVNDANDMAGALKQVGFDVVLGLDVDKRAFDTKVREFARALEQADVALFFYAGHGLQVGGRNFLMPVDARLQGERDLDFEAMSVDFVLRQMELDREGKTNVVFLDACRDNPLARNLARSMGTRSANIGQGLAQVQTGVGTFIAYSTQPGNVALDGQGRNSPFTAALTKGLREPGRNLTSVMIDVRKDVLTATNGKQVPWDHSALTGEFYFQLAAAPGTLPKSPQPGSDSAAVQERLRQLEAELKKKSDPQQTAKMVELAQARERLRQLEEANRADQKLIFEMQYNSTRTTETTSRNNPSMEIGAVQMRMVRRGQEQKALHEQIAKLEVDLGLAAAQPGAATKQ